MAIYVRIDGVPSPESATADREQPHKVEWSNADWFDYHGNSVRGWVTHSTMLQEVAYFLETDYEKRRSTSPGASAVFVAAFLRAFQVECLLKALWLAQGNTLAEGGEIVNCRVHDLVMLAERVGIETTQAEHKALLELTLWGELGRYPVARSVQAEHHRTGAVPNRDDVRSVTRKVYDTICATLTAKANDSEG